MSVELNVVGQMLAADIPVIVPVVGETIILPTIRAVPTIAVGIFHAGILIAKPTVYCNFKARSARERVGY